jgi:citrate lyase beta subunit
MTVDIEEALRRIDALLAPVDAALARDYPGDRGGNQPIHSVYVPADRVSPDTVAQWQSQARALLEEHSAFVATLGGGVDVDALDRILATAPIQDLRADFEDGYTHLGDAAEDADARRVGAVLAGLGGSPPRFGIRARGLEPAERRRGLQTLALVLDGAGGVPDGFVFTVPKVRSADQVAAIIAICQTLERAHGLPERSLGFELQIESPHIVLGADGTDGIARAIRESDGRCSALHFGTYDYTAALGIAPRHQSLAHPAADHAKAVIMLAAAQAGVWVSDGSTQVAPTGTADEQRAALALHFDLVTRALAGGIYQGWDMHPGHLVSRWAATLAFYREAMPTAVARIAAYRGHATTGTSVDEPATAQALASLVVRGLGCGAFTLTQVREHASDIDETVLDDLVHRRPLGSR